MNIVKGALSGIAVVLILLGFLSWRFEFDLPLFGFWSYIIFGVILGVALIWGKMIGKVLMWVSILPFGYTIVLFLFSKSTTWSVVSDAVIYGSLALVSGVVLFYVGSEEVYEDLQANQEYSNRKVVCSECDQFLGRAGSFKSPGTRCGSNRYEIEE